MLATRPIGARAALPIAGALVAALLTLVVSGCRRESPSSPAGSEASSPTAKAGEAGGDALANLEEKLRPPASSISETSVTKGPTDVGATPLAPAESAAPTSTEPSASTGAEAAPELELDPEEARAAFETLCEGLTRAIATADIEAATEHLMSDADLDEVLTPTGRSIIRGALGPKNRSALETLIDTLRGREITGKGAYGSIAPARPKGMLVPGTPILGRSRLELTAGDSVVVVELRQLIWRAGAWKVFQLEL